MIEELKPCPFCHEKEHLKYEYLDLRTPGNTLIPVWVACMNCGCHGKVVWIDWIWTDVVKERFDKLAAEAWNTRYEPDELLPKWARNKILSKFNEHVNQDNDNYYRGILCALEWVLSLRKPEDD